MKIFDSEEYGFSKINFVDEDNVFVGYDMSQCCCETAGWYITELKSFDLERCGVFEGFNESEWRFDKSFIEEVNYIKNGDYDYNTLEDGGMVMFRLISGDKECFLHIFNCHNGYYGHGFEFKIGDDLIKEGCL